MPSDTDTPEAIIRDLAQSEMWFDWRGHQCCADCNCWRGQTHDADCLVARPQALVAREATLCPEP